MTAGGDSPPTTASPGPPPHRRPGLPLLAVTSVVAGVLLLGAVLYLDGTLFFPERQNPRIPPAGTKDLYNIVSVFVSFTGSASSDFVANQLKCAPGNPPSCGHGFAEASGIFIPFVVTLSSAHSCANLSTYQVNEVASSPLGAFVVTNISTNDSAPEPNPGFLPLPAFVPWGNSTDCNTNVQLFVTLMVVPQGPIDQTLFLTVYVSY